MGSKSKNKSKNKESKPVEGNAGGAAAIGGGSQQSGSKVIKDPRFASIHTDPRFRKAPKHKSKVVLDSRFSHIFTDKNFASTKARIDKRGKPKTDPSQSRLKQYYQLDDEEEEALKRDEELKKKDAESEEESENEKLKMKKGNLMSKLDESESEEDDEEEAESDDSSSTSSTDSDEEDAVYPEEEDTFVQEENIPDIEKETHRLAVVNMDWGRVKAVDLFVLLSSFLPKEGQIKSVAVYPSEFGLKRMEEEAVHGPVGLFDEEKGKNKNSDDDDDDDDEEELDEDDDDDSDEDDDDEIDNEKLRAYELSRLRYYYAVVDCDSSATADHLYKNCDGIEFERTSNKLDLRFIPDSMEFKHESRDVATEAPSSYEGLDFHTRALQHSNIELTWDEDEPQRARSLKRKFNADQLAELELKEFLASDESEPDDDDTEDRPVKKHKKQDIYRALLQSGDGSDGSDKDDDKEDMEVTFNTGLEDLSKRILEKKDKPSESVWEAYLRKRKEKKKARKNRSKDSSDDESSDFDDQEHLDQPDDDDFFEEEPLASRNKKVKGKRAKKGKLDQETAQEAEAASKAELELLLADENGGDANLKGYNIKRRKGKDKKGKSIIDEDKIPSVDYNDPRFSSLYTKPDFALDPTDPQFKRSAVYVRQLAEKQHKVDQEIDGGKEQSDIARPQQPSKESKAEELPSRKEKHELSSLVKSVKMKSKQIQLPSQNKVKRSDKRRAKTK